MSEESERLAKLEESIEWIKRELTVIRMKLDKIPQNKLTSRILAVFLAAIVTWLSVLTYLSVNMHR